jgi:membrane fusion protein (multidrug efflux system)
VLQKKFYKEGQYVKKGELLYKIEPDIYKAQLDATLANLMVAKANLYKAQRDWERYSSLYKEHAVSQKIRDDMLSAYKSAKAQVDAAKSQVKLAKINLDYTDVKATISGVTGLKLADVGEYITADRKLVEITQIDPIHAEFSIPNLDMLKAKYSVNNGSWSNPQLRAYINVNKKEYKGYVDFIDKKVEVSTSTTKTRAVFENKERELMPGEFVRIMLHGLIRKDAIVIPQKAVLQDPLGTVVFVVDKGKAQAKPVKLGETSGNYYIIEQGLQEGDLVIVNNFFKVKPGMPVKIDKIINIKKH